MKYSKALPISISSVILAIFIAVSFIVYDVSEAVSVKGVADSYAQIFANENDLEFIEINDSENDKIEIPIIDEGSYAKNQKNKTAKNRLETPKNLVAKAKSLDSIYLTWDAVKNADGYDIYQASTVSGYKKIATTYAKSPTNFLVIKLRPNTTYFYAVQATTKNEIIKDSKFSEVSYATTAKDNAQFSYNYEGETVNITEYKGTDVEVVVPETIDELPVKTISMPVLGRGIQSVQIPESVTQINSEFKSARYDTTFFTALSIMLLGFVFSIAATFIGLKKANNAEGTFYGIPFVYSGMVTYIGMSIWCFVALFIGLNPIVQILVAIVIFGIAVIKLLMRNAARKLVVDKGEKVKQQTQIIKLLTADAVGIKTSAKSDECKALANKVYEALRYIDPMSVPELAEIEERIKKELVAFSDAVNNDDVELAAKSAEELEKLIKERNNKCKVLK